MNMSAHDPDESLKIPGKVYSTTNKKVTHNPMATHYVNLDIIRRACIEANPEIMELEFGCKLTVNWMENDNDPKYHQTLYWPEDMRPNGENSVIWDNMTGDIVEILGRTIRLADVLLALPAGLYISSGGLFVESSHGLDGSTALDSKESWDLRHDDLSAQSPETLSFLAGLLEKK